MEQTNLRERNVTASDETYTSDRSTTTTQRVWHSAAAEPSQEPGSMKFSAQSSRFEAKFSLEGDNIRKSAEQEEKKKAGGTKSLWVTRLSCFNCGKPGHNPPKCGQCSQAYYCNDGCQRKHWKTHKPVCQAAVAALALHAHQLRVARAVREKDNAEGEVKEEDKLCVICLDTLESAVQVRRVWLEI